MPEITEKIVSLDEAKVFRTSADLAICYPGEMRLFHFQNPVEVLGDDGKRIGWAALTWVALDLLAADLVFDYASPERFDIQTQSRKLYARMKGVMTLSVEPFEIVGLLPSVVHKGLEDVQITAVVLGAEPGLQLQTPLGFPRGTL